jgi:GNAT superfamily N-acetyltransferase
MKKPWVQGLEYYIDEFCVRYDMQGKGVGSWFIKAIEENVHKQGMNTIILNTERGFPSHNFYLKNGFRVINNLIVLIKSFH